MRKTDPRLALRLAVYGHLPLCKTYLHLCNGVSCVRISGLSFGTVVPGHDVFCAPASIRATGFVYQGAFG